MHADKVIELVASCYAGLKKVQTLSLGMYPDGIDPDKYGFRSLELEDTDNNGARILVLFERLFSQGGEGEGIGLHIDGVFFVDKVVENTAQWTLVSEPTVYDNRLDRLIKHLDMARKKAKAVPESTDLGIHNPGDPVLSMTPTDFGTYVKVGGFQS